MNHQILAEQPGSRQVELLQTEVARLNHKCKMQATEMLSMQAEIDLPRTAKQIVDQTHALAEAFYKHLGYVHNRSIHGNLYESQHPMEQSMWHIACLAQIELTDTDPEDALSELDGEENDEQ